LRLREHLAPDCATVTLIERLKDDSEEERRSAIKELGRLDDPGAMQPLISVLQNENEDRWVRSDAAEALGSIRDERALEALIAALKDENLYHGAAKGLGRMGDKRAIEPLKALLQDNAVKLTVS
jgi:HEAT repeat protein